MKIRDEAIVRSKAIDLAVAVLPDGTRDILGLWIEQTEGANYGGRVVAVRLDLDHSVLRLLTGCPAPDVHDPRA